MLGIVWNFGYIMRVEFYLIKSLISEINLYLNKRNALQILEKRFFEISFSLIISNINFKKKNIWKRLSILFYEVEDILEIARLKKTKP